MMTIKNIKTTVIGFLIILCSLYFPAYSSEDSPLIISQRIDELFNSTSIYDEEHLLSIEQLIKDTQRLQLESDYIKAHAVKADLLAGMENYNQVSPIIDEFLPKAKHLKLNNVVLRFEILQLMQSDIAENHQLSTMLRMTLVNKVNESENQSQNAEIHLAIGNSYFESNDTTRALQNLNKAYQIFANLNDEQGLASTLNALANVHTELKDIKKAISYYKESIALSKGAESEQSIIFHNMARAYMKLKDYKNAKSYLNQSLIIAEKENHTYGIAFINIGFATIAKEQELPKKAIEYYRKAHLLFAEQGDKRMVFQTLLGKMEAHLNINDLTAAQNTLNSLSTMTDVLEISWLNSTYQEFKARLLAAQGNYQQAYHLQKKYSQSIKEQYELEKTENIESLMLLYASERNEIEKKKLKEESALKSLQISQQESEKKLWRIIIIFTTLAVIIAIILLTKQIKHRNQFRQLAMYDDLTSAPNRRAILKYAQLSYKTCEKNHSALTVAIADIDYFKHINDNYGHDVGDKVLKTFAKACVSVLRKNDNFGRYGGEEWLFVFANTNEEEVIAVFKRIHHYLNAQQIDKLPEKEIINFSVGVAQYDVKNKQPLNDIIKEADARLYKAKANGRNGINCQKSFVSFG